MAKSKLKDLGHRLQVLRQDRGITQATLAASLGVGQTALSHAEQRDDALVSTVAAYIEALGGTLAMQAHFDDAAVDLLEDTPGSLPTDTPTGEDEQLSLFDAEGGLKPAVRDIVLSIHPNHAANILRGKKTVELRRRFTTTVRPGARAIIYTTSPTRAVTGSAAIEGVIRLPVADLWKRYRAEACLARRDFDAYFRGLNEGYAILLKQPTRFQRSVGLLELRQSYGFSPPQSYSYASQMLRKLLADGH